METLMIIIASVAMLLGFVWFTHWFMEKFMGTKIHGRFEAFEAVKELEKEEKKLNEYPESLKLDAVQACKRKGYRITTTNVLAESHRLLVKNESAYVVTENQMKEIDQLLMVENWKSAGNMRDKQSLEVARIVQLRSLGKISKWQYYLELRRVFNIQ